MTSFIIQKLNWRTEYTCEYTETDEISLKLLSNLLNSAPKNTDYFFIFLAVLSCLRKTWN